MKDAVLVTGGAGYVGSVLVRLLLKAGFQVTVLDALMYNNFYSLEEVCDSPNFRFIYGDIRDQNTLEIALEEVESIVHLAALVGDPACTKDPELAREVNIEASKNLISTSIKKRIHRFIFASTCSNYGKQDSDRFLTEEDELLPVSLYARTKVDVERFLMDAIGNDFCPCVLRLSTVFGGSPRMRFDLLINEFTRDAFLRRKLVVYGEQFWRPYIHVSNVAEAFLLALNVEWERIKEKTFNVGDNGQNHTKKDIVEIISSFIPDVDISYVAKDENPRNYRVSFDKIHDQLGYTTTVSVPQGVEEVTQLLENGRYVDPYDIKYSNDR
jgi:nucleoside-diphosphate-sugar epimerase